MNVYGAAGKAWLGLVAGLMMVSGTAVGADLLGRGGAYARLPPPLAAPLPQRYDWSGAYLGVNAGGEFGSLDWTFVSNGTTDPQRPAGGLAGVTLGYNLQSGPFVYGLEADFDYAAFDSFSDVHNFNSCPNIDFDCQSKLRAFSTVRARVGWASDVLYLYATGGLALGQMTIQTEYDGAVPPPQGFPPGDIVGTTAWVPGGVVGVGVELPLFLNTTLKAEWLYFQLAARDYTVHAGAVANAAERGNIVRIGVNWHLK